MERVTQALAKFAANLKFEDLDPKLLLNFKKYLLDGIGCGLYGTVCIGVKSLIDLLRNNAVKRNRPYGCKNLEVPVRMFHWDWV